MLSAITLILLNIYPSRFASTAKPRIRGGTQPFGPVGRYLSGPSSHPSWPDCSP
jgi:hypothetical protein